MSYNRIGNSKNQGGFTLIELIVVIVVLGVLAAVAIPQYLDVTKQARIGALNGLKTAIQGAMTLTDAQAKLEGKVYNSLGTAHTDTISYGNPAVSVGLVDGKSGTFLPAAKDLGQIVNYTDASAPGFAGSGFTLVTDATNGTATFTYKNGSNSFPNCKITYTEAKPGQGATGTATDASLVVDTSGC